MKVNDSTRATQRKKVRFSFNWGQVKLLLSFSDNIRGSRLNEQDRLDIAFPYRLEFASGYRLNGRYCLDSAEGGLQTWADLTGLRVWSVKHGRRESKLITDLTEYERVVWEDVVMQAAGARTLFFEPLIWPVPDIAMTSLGIYSPARWAQLMVVR